MKRLLLFLVFAGSLSAAPPAWWSNAPTRIYPPSPTPTPNNAGPVNGAQLKNVAKKAALYLTNTLPAPGAGVRIDAMVSGFHKNGGDLSPINIGQLKAVAKPFYNRLIGLGYGTKQSLINHGAPAWAFDYPWNPATLRTDNLKPANIGQLKWVFSFDLTGFSVIDTDGDGLTNAWESAHGLNSGDPGDAAASDVDSDGMSDVWEIKWGMAATEGDSNGNGMCDAFEDFDSDGISNEEEAAFNTNPYSTDTDSDGMTDQQELANDFDPTDPSDASKDPDLDGYTNLEELTQGTFPYDRCDVDPLRRIKAAFQQTSTGWNSNTNTWDAPVVSSWDASILIGPVGSGEYPFYGRYTASFADHQNKLETALKLTNVGSTDYPVKVRWVEWLENSSSGACQFTARSELVTTTKDLAFPLPANGYSTGMMTWSARASGDDFYERYGANESPEYATIMMPTEGAAQTDVDLWINGVGLSSCTLSAGPGLTVDPGTGYGNGPTHFTLKNVSGAGEAFVTIKGYGDTSASGHEQKILRVEKFDKIPCTVQPYVVTLHINVPATSEHPAFSYDESPTVLPTAHDLEIKLNEIYEKQMNVHFTVNAFAPLPALGSPSLNYDVGVGTPYDTAHPGTSGNHILDVMSDQTLATPSAEETALFAAGYTSTPGVINVYFLPTGICVHGSKDSYPGGTSRYFKNVALIGWRWAPPDNPEKLAKVKDSIKLTVAHEIGHIGMGAAGPDKKVCLFHSREKDGTTRPEGFRLKRQSDDMKRLMWWNGDDGLGPLLIYEEWMRFRASKTQ